MVSIVDVITAQAVDMSPCHGLLLLSTQGRHEISVLTLAITVFEWNA